jgi:hypothetical protein
MRRSLVFVRVVTILSVLAGGGALAATTASAASGYISVLDSSATSPASNPGLLSVTISSDMPLTSMTVDIESASNSTTLLSLPMSDFTVPANDGDGSYGTWTLTTPISTTDLPLGTYAVYVTAASADASITSIPAGSLLFVDEVSFPTFTSSGATFNYDDQDVTFNGTASILTPGGSPAPLADTSVTLEGGQGPTTVTTGADGSFTVSVPAVSSVYYMQYFSTPTSGPAQSSPITITLQQFTTTLNAKLTVVHARYGQPDEVTGTLTYLDNGVTKPLAGNTVSLEESEYYTPTATAVTSSTGQFTIPVPTNVGSDTWYLTSSETTYFTAASVNLPMTVAEPNFILGFHAGLNAFAVVHVYGCVGTSSGKVEVQYAPRPRGPWRNLGRWPFSGYSCEVGSHQGFEYTGNYYAQLASAYYRVVYTGTYQEEGVVTNAIHLSRLFTKITNFSVSPTRVATNGRFRVSGRLWAQNKRGKFLPDGDQHVIVVFDYQGTPYRYPAEPKTSKAGYFSGSFVIVDTSPVFAQYNGDATHFASASNRIKVTDTGAGRATATTPAVLGYQRAVPLAATPLRLVS